jgi:hypothetical protein
MKVSAVHWVLLLLLAGILMGITGCASDDPDNDSVRPWNAPQAWEGGMPIQNEQHGE